MESWVSYNDPYVIELERKVGLAGEGVSVSRAMFEVKGDVSDLVVYAFKENWYLGRTVKNIRDSDEEAAYATKHADIVVE